MNLELLISLSIPTVVALFGWWAVHRFESLRDQEQKRRELIVQYLIDAWRRLEREAHRAKGTSNPEALEQAIADIQLFGNPKQIQLAQKFANQIAAAGSADVDDLLKVLREDLRAELDLAPIGEKTVHLRISNR